MKLMFIGADHEVTGSCHYIEACGKSILLDCRWNFLRSELDQPGDGGCYFF